ncbi:MAG: membrane protein insertase YidC [bacterium]|nr:membrane protein insertase YidC [bacterium]
MDSNKRLLLAIILILAVFLGFQFLMPKPAPQPAVQQTAPAASEPAAVQAVLAQPSAAPAKSPKLKTPGLPITQKILKGKGFEAVLTNQGAALSGYRLLDYMDPQGQPVQMIPDSGRALTMNLSVAGQPVDLSEVVFETGQEFDGSITYQARLADGVVIQKTYGLLENAPGLSLKIKITAPGNVYLSSKYNLAWDCGLNSTEKNKESDLLEFAALAMLGKDLVSDNLTKLAKNQNLPAIEGDIAYCGVRTKYFVAALVPKSRKGASVQQGLKDKDRLTTSLGLPLASGTEDEIAVYLGPIDHGMLAKVDSGLDKIADTGWKWIQPISRGILWFLLALHNFIPNYGVVIIIFSVLMKLVFFPLTYTGMRSMKKMQHLQPHLKKVQAQHKSDPGKLNQETMALYKKHGVNPFSGCIPLVLQMPVFFALYSVLINTIELRQAPFMLWITDLSLPDSIVSFGGKLPLVGWESLSLLPILMGVAMFFQQKMTTVDPKQKMMVYMMPVFMVFIFMSLPAGLNLYWLINNILSIGEQYLIHIRTQPPAEA